MSAAWTLTIDQGGHGTRALVFDPHGHEQARAHCEIGVHRHGADCVEHDAAEVLRSVDEVLAAAIAASPTCPERVGLATQRSSIVCWQRSTGTPLSPVISWQDRRAAALLAKCVAGRDDEVRTRTGLIPSPHFGASKLRWCLDELPAVQQAQGDVVIGPLASFIAQHLTGGPPVVDAANAARTMLWNVDDCDWDKVLLSWFGIPAGLLPATAHTCSDFGPLRDHPMELCAVSGDQSAALFADGEPTAGDVFVNLGTGAFLQRVAAVEQRPARLPRSVVLQDEAGARCVVEGTVNGAAAALSWWRAERQLDAAELRAALPGWLEQRLDPPVFVNGVSGLGSPDWISHFPSRFVGADATLAEEAVAVIESIVFLIARNLDEMEQTCGAPDEIVVAGGLSRLSGLCQRLANLTATAVVRRDHDEATARGIAYLATASRDRWQPSPTSAFVPASDPDLRRRYDLWRRQMP
ncbi:MAG: FGGY family carbohydrate kinase [Planctomycetota bacterium]